MSDKETANSDWRWWFDRTPESRLNMIQQFRSAAECRAPAPQPAAIATLQNSLLGHDSEEDSSGNIVMRFNCGEWLDIAMAVKSLAATPQVTPWKAHFTDSDVTGDIHNYVDTGDGKRLWAQDADEIVKRHNEGTSERKEKP